MSTFSLSLSLIDELRGPEPRQFISFGPQSARPLLGISGRRQAAVCCVQLYGDLEFLDQIAVENEKVAEVDRTAREIAL